MMHVLDICLTALVVALAAAVLARRLGPRRRARWPGCAGGCCCPGGGAGGLRGRAVQRADVVRRGFQ